MGCPSVQRHEDLKSIEHPTETFNIEEMKEWWQIGNPGRAPPTNVAVECARNGLHTATSLSSFSIQRVLQGGAHPSKAMKTLKALSNQKSVTIVELH